MSLRALWLDFRDRCFASPRFMELTTAAPPLRPLIRRRQAELFDLVSGFVYSQILAACVSLDVFSAVRDGATTAALAARIGLDEEAARRLAEGARALRLLDRADGRWRLGDLGAALVANPGVIAMIRHHDALYADLAAPDALLRGARGETRLSRYWAYARDAAPAAAAAERVAPFSALMSESLGMIATEALAAHDFTRHRRLLDIGGGDGAFLERVATAAPALELTLFDLPAVAERATARLNAAGLGARAKAYGGSFFDDPLPTGADVATLNRVLLDHDDAPAAAILAAARAALPPGGALVICEPMVAGGSARRMSGAYFNLYLYAMGSGRPRSAKTLTKMLRAAGFAHVGRPRARFPLIATVIVATR